MGLGSSKNDEPHEAYQRRKIISDLNIKISSDIKVLAEYIECPSGNVIYTKCFIPSTSMISSPKGLICQCIGYTGYSDYDFTLIAQEYCKKGYIFFIWDHYGHGRSSGLWIHIDDINILINDTIYLCNYAKSKYKLTNNYLIGTSMGGNIVSRVLIQYKNDNRSIKNEWNGIILYSPMVSVDPKHIYNPFMMYIIEKWIAYYLPTATLIPKTVSKDTTSLSRDRNYAKILSQNPLIWPYGPRPITGVQIMKTTRYVQSNIDKIGLCDVPLLVLHGTNDDVVQSSMSLKMTEKVESYQTIKDSTTKLMKDGLHSLMVDSCKDECLDIVIKWMQKHNK